ncbi:TonB-dependent receptor domain-containing protein [Methylobacillus flagellatus]|uniref:TonB-dependent receptor n=1 Tax=Methylobacillus flagellatus (strain ATCC 51484 / DSM 6875 / VKM B-1610 / KT) TaxID=265072 RepID=Q1GXJ1_METFK|nr:TonB-dependent receptor [Methylobacillus flagellatus]ABE48393.1 TonB-dependent receptor [Methylobacillus flagellatus KT]
MLRFSLGIAALASIHSFPLIASADGMRLEDTIVTASRSEQKSSEVLGDVSVISQEQIQRAGQSSVLELLGREPGIEIMHNGGLGKSTDIFIRGANSTHTLVLIDGIRVSSATSGTTAIQNISLNQIDHIEILRGPASSMYGADAIGGVIQIFTKSGKGQPRLQASAGLGTYGTAIGDIGVSGRISDTSFSLQAGATHTHGVSAYNRHHRNYNPDHDGYRNQNLNARITQHLSEHHELGFNAFISDNKNFHDGAVRANEYYGEQTLSSYTVHSKNRFTDNWTSTLSIARSMDDLASYSKSATATSRDTIKTTQDQYLWQNTVTTDLGVFNAGLEYRKQKVESNADLAEDRRNIRSWMAGWQKQFDRHGLQMNLRNDDSTQFGDKTTGSINYGYHITPQLRAGAAFGTAFAIPTFNQLYSPLNPAFNYIGNAELRPEESRNKEISLQYDNGTHQIGAIYYHNEVDNLIANSRSLVNGVNRLMPTNINEAVLRGLTLSYKGNFTDWRLYGSADLQRPEDRGDTTSGNLLPRRAKAHANFGVSRTWQSFELGSELEASSYRYDNINNTPSSRMSGYTLVNVYANYRINPDWTLNARVNNLFDRHYELAQGFSTLGANLFVSLRYAPAF